MREFPFAIGAAVCSGVVTYSLSAIAGPVTEADLRGKTICWSYGGTRNTYGKDGSLDSNLVGHGTWTLVGDRITEHGDHGVFSFTIDFTCMGGVQAAAGWTSPGATANKPPTDAIRLPAGGAPALT